nr:hypothetical protein [Tanacetum cinerariifolium]
MMIEQYFLMTDYSLWEVILNGHSPIPTRVVDGVLWPVAPTTAEQRLARKNELKAHGTLLMALPDKHQLKFNSHKDAKNLMEDIEKRFGGNTKTKKEHSLDDLFNSLKIYKDEVKSSSTASTNTQNLAFVSSFNTDSTTELVSVAVSVSAVYAKMLVSSLPNVDSLSNAIDADDLKKIDLKWQMAMLTMRARRFLQRTGRNLKANGPTSLGFDMSKVKCNNCHRKGHFTRECRSPKDTRRNGAAEPQRRNVPVQLRDNALVNLRQTLEKAEQERDEFKLKLAKFQTSSKNLTELLASQTNAKIGSDESFPLSPIYDRYQSGISDVETDHPTFNVKLSPTKHNQDLSHTHRPSVPIMEDWHVETSIPPATSKTAIPKLTSNGKRKNRKACFVYKSLDHLIKDCDYHDQKMAQTPPRNHAPKGYHKNYARMPLSNTQRHVVPIAVVPKSKLVPINAARPITADVPEIKVTRPRQEKSVVTKLNSPPR